MRTSGLIAAAANSIDAAASLADAGSVVDCVGQLGRIYGNWACRLVSWDKCLDKLLMAA